MNGQIFNQENVKKNQKMGIFEELELTLWISYKEFLQY
jgi:hypothetical protein